MKLFVSVVISFLFLSTAATVSAQGFFVCEGTSCSACDLVSLGNLLVKWLLGIVFVLFGLVMTLAGFGLVTSGGNPSALQSAKNKFTNALIGLLIVLSAWLIVDTIMRGLVGDDGEIAGYGPWTQIECGSQTKSGIDADVVYEETFWVGDPNSPANTATVVATESCIEYTRGFYDCDAAKSRCPAGSVPAEVGGYVNCVASRSGPATFSGTPAGACGSDVSCAAMTIPCKSGANCSISPDMVDRLSAMHTAAGVSGARATEGYPPTREHKSRCHYNGTCIDYSKAGGMTSAEVKAVSDAAIANGLRPVYEVTSERRRQELISAGVPAGNVKNLGSWISAEHFSIYGY